MKKEIDGISFTREKSGFYRASNTKKYPYLLLHNYLWEKERSNIPKDWKVVFVDGDKRNVELSNLICLPRDSCYKNEYEKYCELIEQGANSFAEIAKKSGVSYNRVYYVCRLFGKTKVRKHMIFDGICFNKHSNGTYCSNNPFRKLHVYLWEREHGKVNHLKGHVIFKNGDTDDFSLENLFYVQKREKYKLDTYDVYKKVKFMRESGDALESIAFVFKKSITWVSFMLSSHGYEEKQSDEINYIYYNDIKFSVDYEGYYVAVRKHVHGYLYLHEYKYKREVGKARGDVYHSDGDKLNNSIENLVCINV